MLKHTSCDMRISSEHTAGSGTQHFEKGEVGFCTLYLAGSNAEWKGEMSASRSGHSSSESAPSGVM